MKACVPAENRAPALNSWSKPAIGTPCSVMQSVTVPCETPTVGTPASRAAKRASDDVRSLERSQLSRINIPKKGIKLLNSLAPKPNFQAKFW
jgi:hypothetical protein